MALNKTHSSTDTEIAYQLMLADDDADDCLLFREALEELAVNATLNVANDGIFLMEALRENKDSLPAAIFLDLNMPRKSGFECLKELREEKATSSVPVIILSTSYNREVAESLYADGANYYIQKPTDFPKLKSAIKLVLDMISENKLQRPGDKKSFVIAP